MNVPRETSGDLMAKALASFSAALEAFKAELAAVKSLPDPSEVIDFSDTGYSRQSVALWCRRGLIEGATRRGRRGHWRFTRSSFSTFMTGGRRRRRLSIAA